MIWLELELEILVWKIDYDLTFIRMYKKNTKHSEVLLLRIIFHLFFLFLIRSVNHSEVSPHVSCKNGESDNKHGWIFHHSLFSWLVSLLICRIATEKPRIEGTQIPTKMPSNLFPVNHKETEYKKDKKARITG